MDSLLRTGWKLSSDTWDDASHKANIESIIEKLHAPTCRSDVDNRDARNWLEAFGKGKNGERWSWTREGIGSAELEHEDHRQPDTSRVVAAMYKVQHCPYITSRMDCPFGIDVCTSFV